MDSRSYFSSRRRDRSVRKARRLWLEILETRALLAGPNLTVSPAVDVSKLPGNQAEEVIAINPTNPKNVVVLSNSANPGTGLFYAVSFDGGKTFATSTIANGGDFPAACCDPSAVFDSFGNLFVDYLTYSNAGYILMSADGGKTFKQVEQTTTNDQPKLATGPGSTPGTASIWMEYVDGNNLIAAVGAPITGLGKIGSFTSPIEVADEPGGDGNFGKPAVGPKGQFMVSYESPSGGVGPAQLLEAYLPQGLAGTAFQPSVLISNTNVGGFAPVPAQPNRTVDAEVQLAYDSSGGKYNGRLYAVYTDSPAVNSSATDIYLRHSDNNGTTWSAPVKVTDDTSGRSKFMPRIAIDQTTGYIAISWYDARKDSTQKSVGFYATVSADGGQTFAPNVQVSLGSSNVATATVDGSFDFGDYTGLDFTHGVFYPVWADNSTQLPGNPDLPTLDIATAAVQVSNPITVAIAPIQLNEGQTFSGTVGTFTTTIAGATAASFSASMNFGGGAIAAGTITGPDANGVYTVTASNPYVEGGSFATTLTITGPNGATASANGTATIVDAPISASALANATSLEGNSAPILLGSFTDKDVNSTVPSNYSVSILWDDGATTVGTVRVDPAQPGLFDVFGARPQEEGKHKVQVSIVDQGGATAGFTTVVTDIDAPLTAGKPLTIAATAGLPYQGFVATFADANPNAIPEDFVARITWDGTHTTFGTVGYNGVTRLFSVSGKFTYGAPGPRNISVSITDDDGSSSVIATGKALVADAQLQSTVTLPVQTVVGASNPVNVGEFTYANLQATPSAFSSVVINWGDGSPSTSGTVVSAGNGAFYVVGSHAYHTTGNFSISALVTDVAGNSVVTTGSANVADAPISLGVVSFQPIQLTNYDGGVAFFTSANQYATPSIFQATIDWGDGTASTGTVLADPKGGYDVFGSHTYAQDQGYTVTVSVQSALGSAASATGPISVSTAIVPVTALLNPASDSGPSNSDDVTNVVTPNFIGHAAPSALVSLFSIQAGQTAPVSLGQVRADASGNWNLTAGPFVDGGYVILASATSANGHPDSPLAPVLSRPLVIDTRSPVVAASLYDPRSGQIEIAFVDYTSGMDLASLINPFAFGVTLTLPGRAPQALPSLPDGLLIPSPGVYVLMLAVGKAPAGSIYNLAIASPFVIDNAGNPLDGSFSGGFPSGNGTPGSLFQAQFNVAGSAAPVVAQAIYPATDLAGALTHENLLTVHTQGRRAGFFARRRG